MATDADGGVLVATSPKKPTPRRKRPYGDGSVFERKDGRWVAAVRHEGKRLVRYATLDLYALVLEDDDAAAVAALTDVLIPPGGPAPPVARPLPSAGEADDGAATTAREAQAPDADGARRGELGRGGPEGRA